MLFHRLDQLIDGKAQASALFSGPYYFAEQLGFRKIIDTTFMIATMVTGDPDPEDLRKFFRALKRAQRDIDLRPDLYTHYYKNEFPARYHAMMDTRRWGPGERLVFEPYTKEVYEETFKWIADHGIFADSGMGIGQLRGSGHPRGAVRPPYRSRIAPAWAGSDPFLRAQRRPRPGHVPERNRASPETISRYARAGTPADRLLADERAGSPRAPFLPASATAVLNSARSAAISGELASLARRAHSAAWTWQYLAYDDMTRPLHLHTLICISVRQLTAKNLMRPHICSITIIYSVPRPIKGMTARRLNSSVNCCLATTDPGRRCLPPHRH